MAVRQHFPNRSRGRATLMPSIFPSEPRLPAETSHGRSNGRGLGSVRLGFPSERSLKVRHLPWEQEQAGALPAALTIFTRRECR